MRNIVGAILFLVALNAFGGGFYGMFGAKSVPLAWLENSPFKNYFIPGSILFFVVGGSSLFSAILIFRKHKFAKSSSNLSGIIICVWIIAQLLIIGFVSWLQPIVLMTGLIILLLTTKINNDAG